MRRSVSLCNTAESDGSRTHVLEQDPGVHRGIPVDLKHDTAQLLLARGVKRRLQNGSPQLSIDLAFAGPTKQALSLHPCPDTLQGGLQGGPQSEGAGRPGSCFSDWNCALQQKHGPHGWRPAFRPMQQLGTYSSPWPIQTASAAATTARPSTRWQHVQESDADVAVDVDCCGDSGSMSKLSSVHPAVPTECFKRSLCRCSADGNAEDCLHQSASNQQTLPVAGSRIYVESSQEQGRDSSMPMATTPRMPHAGSELSEQQASTEMAFRLDHARQTVQFVQRQAASFRHLNKGKLGVWEALQLLDSSTHQTSGSARGADDQHMSVTEHAIQTAELCRLASPQQDWLHLVGLVHGLGKLMALPRFGSQPEWAVYSESFPVGCRFSGSITCSHFFSVNPDRRRRLYNNATGMYQPGCGLAAVYMSWTAYEYLYLILLENKTALPPVARFVLRHCNFLALTQPGGAYSELLNSVDLAMMPWLSKFQAIQRSGQQSLKGQLQREEVRRYYDTLIAKYIPGSKLQF